MIVDIKLNVTPKELREFFGLPDVQPLQQEMLEKLRIQLQSGAEELDPVALMRPFLAPNLATMESMHKAFWQAFTDASRGKADE